VSPLGPYQRRAVDRYMRSFDLDSDDDCNPDCEATMDTCRYHEAIDEMRRDHANRLDSLEEKHAELLAVMAAAKGAIAEKLLWLFVTALICGGVSVVVSLLTAGAGG
jgi:hypothetical protein